MITAGRLRLADRPGRETELNAQLSLSGRSLTSALTVCRWNGCHQAVNAMKCRETGSLSPGRRFFEVSKAE